MFGDVYVFGNILVLNSTHLISKLDQYLCFHASNPVPEFG